jgi:hypothetical protein
MYLTSFILAFDLPLVWVIAGAQLLDPGHQDNDYSSCAN